MTNPLLELKTPGQSVWLDDIDPGNCKDEGVQRMHGSISQKTS